MRCSATSAAEAVQPGVTDSNPVLTGTAHEEPLLSSHARIQVKRLNPYRPAQSVHELGETQNSWARGLPRPQHGFCRPTRKRPEGRAPKSPRIQMKRFACPRLGMSYKLTTTKLRRLGVQNGR